MLAGRPAFEAATPVALVDAQRHPPDSIAGVPPGLAQISLRALDPDPARRPASAATMAADLRAWTRRVQIETGVAGVTTSGAGATSTAAVTGSDDPTVVARIPEVADPAAESGLWWTGTIDGRTAPEEAGWPLEHEPRSRRRRRPRWVGPLIAVAGVALAAALVVGLGLPELLNSFAPLPTTGPGAGVVGPSVSPAASPTPAASAAPTDSPTHEPPGKGRKKGH
jgi:hypothetical protein